MSNNFTGYIDLSKRRVSPEEIKKCEEKFTKAKAVSLINSSLNPLTLRSDQHVTSPCNIHTLLSKQVMGILKLIR